MTFFVDYLAKGTENENLEFGEFLERKKGVNFKYNMQSTHYRYSCSSGVFFLFLCCGGRNSIGAGSLGGGLYTQLHYMLRKLPDPETPAMTAASSSSYHRQWQFRGFVGLHRLLLLLLQGSGIGTVLYSMARG